MNIEMDDFQTGFFGLSVRLTPAEIDALIARLHKLKEGSLGHFHFTRVDWDAPTPGIGDVEISLSGPDEQRGTFSIP